MPSCSQANQRSGAGEPALHLVGDEHHVVLAAPGQQCGQKPLGRDDETAFAGDRLDDDGGEVVGADLLVHEADGACGGLFAVGGQLLVEQPVPVGIGQRRPVDLRGERAEAALIGHRLGGERHGQVGASVVGVVERHHGGLVGVGAGDLDGVLDGFGAGVEQHGALLAGARGDPIELLGDGHVLLVRIHHETRVGEFFDLGAHGFHHAGRRVADGGDGDARTQVDEPVPVDVLEDAAAGAGHEHRHRHADAARHRRDSALVQFQRCGTGDFGDQLPTLLEAGHFVLLTAARGFASRLKPNR